MINNPILRRGIPSVAALAVAFTGCGAEEERSGDVEFDTQGQDVDGGMNDTSDAGRDTAVSTAMLRRFCVESIDCYPDYYRTVEECISYNHYFLYEYRTEDDVDPDCLDAWYAYAECWFANATCQEYAYDGETSEQMRAEPLCDAFLPPLDGCFE